MVITLFLLPWKIAIAMPQFDCEENTNQNKIRPTYKFNPGTTGCWLHVYFAKYFFIIFFSLIPWSLFCQILLSFL